MTTINIYRNATFSAQELVTPTCDASSLRIKSGGTTVTVFMDFSVAEAMASAWEDATAQLPADDESDAPEQRGYDDAKEAHDGR